MTLQVCAPDVDVSLTLPSDWNATPSEPTFARPPDVHYVGSQRLCSCAVVIQDVDWFRFEGKTHTSPRELLEMHFTSERTAAELGAKLLDVREITLDGVEVATRTVFTRRVQGHMMRLTEIHTLRTEEYKGRQHFRLNNVSGSVLFDSVERHLNDLETIVDSASFTTESALGVCFDIKRLEASPDCTNYARFALELFRERADDRLLVGTVLHWGDTLDENYDFCLKFVTSNYKTCPHIREIFGITSDLKSLAPLERRFRTGVKLKALPLPVAGGFTLQGYVKDL